MSIRIKRIALYLYRATVDEPIKTSFGSIAGRTTMLIRIEDEDGAAGWGEIWCSIPAYSAENKIRLMTTGCPTACTAPTTPSSTTAAMPGTNSSIDPGASYQLDCAIGPWVLLSGSWYQSMAVDPSPVSKRFAAANGAPNPSQPCRLGAVSHRPPVTLCARRRPRRDGLKPAGQVDEIIRDGSARRFADHQSALGGDVGDRVAVARHERTVA